MAQLRWTRNSRWRDSNRDIDITGPGIYEVPDEAVDEYLDHWTGGWEHPWKDDEDESFSEDELEEMEYRELQALAKENDIKANQSEEDLIDALTA